MTEYGNSKVAPVVQVAVPSTTGCFGSVLSSLTVTVLSTGVSDHASATTAALPEALPAGVEYLCASQVTVAVLVPAYAGRLSKLQV